MEKLFIFNVKQFTYIFSIWYLNIIEMWLILILVNWYFFVFFLSRNMGKEVKNGWITFFRSNR